MELSSRVEIEISKPFKSQSKNLLFDLYREVFGSLNGLSLTCSSCKHDAYMALGVWLRNNTFMQTSKLNLLTSYYKDRNEKRQKEIEFCLKFNKESGYFDNVITIDHRRPTYNDFFEITQKYPDHVNVIANSDIFFDQSILQAKTIRVIDCYALSRWDYIRGGKIRHWARQDSQDVWIIRGKARIKSGNFHLGVPGCDNRIAYEFKQSGYRVTNPSNRIKSIHLHLTEIRNYDQLKDNVPKPYLMVNPCH